jgi:hypothetical protein
VNGLMRADRGNATPQAAEGWGMRPLSLLALLVLAVSGVGAGPEEGEIPLLYRPPGLPFAGASGRFRARARAEPTTLAAEAPLLFTLTVEATGPVHHPPGRIDLKEVEDFTERFYLEDPTADAVSHPDEKTWEFRYVLKPRSPAVKRIPGVPFVFYDPDIPSERRRFQVQFTDEIPLTVTEPAKLPVPLQGPEGAFTLHTGPGLLARVEPWDLPPWSVLAALLLGPPLLAGLWYVGWKRLYPDAARLASRRRSRAARLALSQLARAEQLPPEHRADRVAEVVAAFPADRFALPVAEPTPREAETYLFRQACRADLVGRASAFVTACDRARFSPAADPDLAGLTREATAFILAVEEEE